MAGWRVTVLHRTSAWGASQLFEVRIARGSLPLPAWFRCFVSFFTGWRVSDLCPAGAFRRGPPKLARRTYGGFSLRDGERARQLLGSQHPTARPSANVESSPLSLGAAQMLALTRTLSYNPHSWHRWAPNCGGVFGGDLMPSFSLTGNVGLATVGSRGIGKTIALAYSKAGASAAIVGRDALTLSQTLDELRNECHEAEAIAADVSRLDDIDTMIEEANDSLGPIDIPVDCAGIASIEPAGAVSEEGWTRLIDTNLKGRFICASPIGGVRIHGARGLARPNNVLCASDFLHVSMYVPRPSLGLPECLGRYVPESACGPT